MQIATENDVTFPPFCLAHVHMARWTSSIRINRLMPRAQILCNTEHAQFVYVSKVDNGGVQYSSAVQYFLWGTRDVV